MQKNVSYQTVITNSLPYTFNPVQKEPHHLPMFQSEHNQNMLGTTTYTPENKHGTLKYPLGKRRNIYKPPIFGFHVCFLGLYFKLYPPEIEHSP